MVHIGCGADVIRQRRRAEQLKKENEANGIFTIPPDFKPAKNKKYPHYTPLRNANVFTERQNLSFVRKRAIYAAAVAEERRGKQLLRRSTEGTFRAKTLDRRKLSIDNVLRGTKRTKSTMPMT